jgi:DNA-binding CsgD family transcriptional regulator
MAKIRIKDKTTSFLNSYNYNKLRSLRKAIKALLKLSSDAELFGSEGAMIIMTDIKSGLDMYDGPFKVLTDRQRECIFLCLVEDMRESDAARHLNISQQSVNASVNSGVKRIQEYLTKGEMAVGVFSDQETKEFIFLYNTGRKPLEIAHIMKKSPRQVRNKIKSLKAQGRIKNRGDTF